MGKGSDQMNPEWDDMVKQRIKQGWTDEQIAVSLPFSIIDIKHKRAEHIKSELTCEHEYEVLYDGIEVEKARFIGNGKVSVELSGYVIFHCKKCLDIQKKVIE